MPCSCSLISVKSIPLLGPACGCVTSGLHWSRREGGASYFGWRPGSPPGVPGGGMTGILPPPTGGTEMPGSTPAGGQITPLDFESCSLRELLPVVSLEGAGDASRPGEQSPRVDGERDGAVGRSVCASAAETASTEADMMTAATVEFRMLISLQESTSRINVPLGPIVPTSLARLVRPECSSGCAQSDGTARCPRHGQECREAPANRIFVATE